MADNILWNRNETDLKVFENHKEVFAGFTRVPTVRDDAIKRWCSECGDGNHVIRLGQVHGKRILKAGEQNEPDPYIFRDGYDGLMTNIPGILLTTGHGDCLPVWIYDPARKVAGLAHAGWKGTALGIAGELTEQMKSEYGCRPEDMIAYIGPGISLCCFEVSSDARAEFAAIPWGEEFIHDDVNERGALTGKSHIDLKGVNRRWLELAGISQENIEICPDCTCCDSEHYYSYRRNGDMRRMAAYFALL